MTTPSSMRLRLEFPDKYRLWSELVKASTDRVFVEIPTSSLPGALRGRLGMRVPIELAVGGVLLVTMGDVVGVRPQGGRFKAGVWVNVSVDEVLKVRRFLGLAEEPSRPATGRRSHREPCSLSVTLKKPELPHGAKLRNLSESGALLETSAPLKAGQFLELEVSLEDGAARRRSGARAKRLVSRHSVRGAR